jgi:prepilin peptidase CpaA
VPELATIAALGVFPALMIVAAITDVATMTIPNRISLVLVPAFFLAAVLARMSPPDIAWHVGLGMAAMALAVGAFAIGLMGGGDAKLMAVAGLWLGPMAATPFLFWMAVAGGVLAALLLAARRLPTGVAEAAPAWTRRLLTPRGGIPYGVAIAAGAIVAFPRSGLWHGLA